MNEGPRFLVEDPRFFRACRIAAVAAAVGGVLFAIVVPNLIRPG